MAVREFCEFDLVVLLDLLVNSFIVERARQKVSRSADHSDLAAFNLIDVVLRRSLLAPVTMVFRGFVKLVLAEFKT